MRLKDKTVLVTASTRGIGLACVKMCAKEGAEVYMAARNLDKAQSICDELNEKGFTVKCVYNDAQKIQTYRTMVEEVVEKSGKLDVLVNNFGTSDTANDLGLCDTSADDFLKIVNMNLLSVFAGSSAAVKYMKKNGGSIVNISSVGGAVPDISQIAYGTSKAAVNYLTKLIAVQEARNNIRCNAVLPGMTATDSVKDNLSDEFRELFMRHVPLKRMCEPEEIAEAVVFFGSDAASYVTGQILTVSGGFGLATPLYGDLNDKRNRAK